MLIQSCWEKCNEDIIASCICGTTLIWLKSSMQLKFTFQWVLFFYLVFFLCVHPLISLMVTVFFAFYYFARSRICLHGLYKIQLWQICNISYIWNVIFLLLIQYECSAIWLFKCLLIAVNLSTLKIVCCCLYSIISHNGNGSLGKERLHWKPYPKYSNKINCAQYTYCILQKQVVLILC